MKLVKFSVFLIIIGTYSLGRSPKKNYLKGLTNYLQKESKLYQVMFVIGDHTINSSSRVDPLFQEVGKNFPTLTMSLSSFRHEVIKTNYSSSLQNPRKTTLFVLFLSGETNETEIQEVTVGNQLKRLSWGNPYPKCLIHLFLPSKSLSIKRLIKNLWWNEFLDISVMTQPNDNERFLTGDKLNESILHQMNRFAGTYSARRITDDIEWFPNKLRNLHGHTLKFLFVHRKGFDSQVRLQNSRKFANLFTEGMNSRGKMYMVNITVIFFKYLLMLNKSRMEMILQKFNLLSKDDTEVKYVRMHVLAFGSVKAVIPRNSKLKKTIEMSDEFITMVCVTIGAIVLLRITAFVLKLSRRTWQTFNISRIVMGMSTDNEPGALSERIIFGVLILSCIAYSSYFYTVILDISWRSQAEITTLKELLDSSLTPMTGQAIKNNLLISPISVIQKLGTKSVMYPDYWSRFDCLTYLSRYENITCIMSDSEEWVANFEWETRNKNTKILEKPMSYYFTTWVTRYNSPYIGRFNKIILRALQSGILSKLFDSVSGKPLNVPPAPEKISKEKLLPLVCYILSIGYTLALIVFIGEILNITKW